MTVPLPSSVPPSPDRSGWLGAFALSLLLSLLVVSPCFWLGTASGHDFEFHAASWLDAAWQWQEGIFYPRWSAWTNHGFGEPRFIFYPPLSWMLGGALSLLLPGPSLPVVFLVLTSTLAGCSAFALLRRLVPRKAALLGAACYVINPYALLLTYVRSDFAEQLACALLPLLVLSALELAELLEATRPARSAIPRFALPFAAVWLANAPAGVIATYSVALLFVVSASIHRSGRILLRGAGGMALGWGLAGFYLLPAAYEQRWVNIGQALSSGLIPAQNFLFTRIDDVEHTWFNWIASYCALLLILLLGLAALGSERFARHVPAASASATEQRRFLALFSLGAAAALLTLRISHALWEHLPELRFVQFPWRWMSVLAVVFCCFASAFLERRRGALWFILFLLCSVPLGSFLITNSWWDPDEMASEHEAIRSGSGFDGTDEYDPAGDDHLDLPRKAPLVEILAGEAGASPSGGPEVQIGSWTTEHKEIDVHAPVAARLALRLLNYPAWQVHVNGQKIIPERREDTDQMVIPVPPGSHRIEVCFSRTPDRTLGNAVSVVSLLTFLFLLVGSPRTAPGSRRSSSR